MIQEFTERTYNGVSGRDFNVGEDGPLAHSCLHCWKGPKHHSGKNLKCVFEPTYYESFGFERAMALAARYAVVMGRRAEGRAQIDREEREARRKARAKSR